ncbi:MAG: FecR family protein [Fuerstiella sp.]
MTFPQRDIDLVSDYCSGTLTDAEFSELESRLRESHELRQLLIEYRSIESALPSAVVAGTMGQAESSAMKKNRAIRRLRIALLAMAAGLALMFGLSFLRPGNEPQIATVRSLSGSVRWTGAGGLVSDVQAAGQSLTGGILETLSVDSSAELKFLDGSTVSLNGSSVLTISDRGQKELRLREGSLSANVVTQPTGKPLRLFTPAATLEVLGTQFDVTADFNQTKISVNEGLVRVKRVTDGQFADVKAAHSLLATIEAQESLVATPITAPISVWVANLAKDRGEGEWISAAHALRLEIGRAIEAGEIKEDDIQTVYGKRLADTRDDDGLIRAIPRRTGREEHPVIYLVSLNIPQRQRGPILLAEGSRLRVKGRTEEPDEVTFSFAARNHDRTIMGRYAASRRVESAFDVEIPVTELRELGDRTTAVGLEAFVFDCFANKPSLEITHVELLAPKE